MQDLFKYPLLIFCIILYISKEKSYEKIRHHWQSYIWFPTKNFHFLSLADKTGLVYGNRSDFEYAVILFI